MLREINVLLRFEAILGPPSTRMPSPGPFWRGCSELYWENPCAPNIPLRVVSKSGRDLQREKKIRAKTAGYSHTGRRSHCAT